MSFDELAERLQRHPSKQFGRGVKDAEIDAASSRLGVTLSGGYRLFLRHLGWGGVGSFELFGLGAEVPPYLSLIEITRSEREEMHPALPVHLIPIMNDGGGNLYCLDARGTGEPPIVLWQHEASEGQEPLREAPDFVMWLAERLAREE